MIASSLAEVGIKVVPVQVTWVDYQRRMASGEFTLARVGWVADYPDPYSFLSLFHSGASANFGGYRNDSYDKALQEAAMAIDAGKRMQAMHQAEAILTGDLPIVPISFGKRLYQEQTRLRDVVHLAVGVPLFSWAWLDGQ